MAANAKVYAWVFTYKRPDIGEHAINVMLEYALLSGAKRSGKVEIQISDIKNEQAMTEDLKEGLAAHLSTVYAPEVFKVKEIVGCTV